MITKNEERNLKVMDLLSKYMKATDSVRSTASTLMVDQPLDNLKYRLKSKLLIMLTQPEDL